LGSPIPTRAEPSRFAFLIGELEYEMAKRVGRNLGSLGPEELGGVRIDGQSIIYTLREPVAAHAYTRATYTNSSDNHFTWRGERSDDLKSWTEFMVVEAYRHKE
jgi:hypothetical protein